MRRILLLITDLEIGGTPTVVRELAMRLHEPGRCEIEVMCLGRWGPVADQISQAGIRVIALNARGPGDLPRVVRSVAQAAKNFDTVFSFLIHANFVAALASWFCRDVQFIQSIQNTQPNPRWHWRLQSFAQNFARKIVVPSPSAAQVAQDWADVSSDKIVVIPNAVEIAQFAVKRSDRSEGAMRIGFIGRLDPIKRIGDLVQAISFLDERFSLHIFGHGEDRANIQRQIASTNVRGRVTLHGSIAKPQAAMEQIALLVLPSDAEGFGLVLIEAMAAGVPIVATDVPGIRDVVQNEKTGLLVPVRNPQALAAAIRRIADSSSLRNRLIQNGLIDVRERFTWNQALPAYRKLLNLE
ncbi:MAG TPA: glycosyltransferase [Tepidisphaeraceae bacterium]|nr:glycosyltransferase [Tepidisphaeraceae bacterium]